MAANGKTEAYYSADKLTSASVNGSDDECVAFQNLCRPFLVLRSFIVYLCGTISFIPGSVTNPSPAAPWTDLKMHPC